MEVDAIHVYHQTMLHKSSFIVHRPPAREQNHCFGGLRTAGASALLHSRCLAADHDIRRRWVAVENNLEAANIGSGLYGLGMSIPICSPRSGRKSGAISRRLCNRSILFCFIVPILHFVPRKKIMLFITSYLRNDVYYKLKYSYYHVIFLITV